ncbi:MAG TPA: OmpA family protein [Allosphingosinicella sp.]|uniref:OmpA family protein n=1 Tax=Allosphingosinicella sp. TaxID=2823234 RepID=UPI002F29EC4E
MSLFLASVPAAAVAQSGATRSAEDYVCALTDDCETTADTPAEAAPTTGVKPRTSATRGFSLSRPGAKPTAKAAAPAPSRSTASSPARTAGKPQPVKTASANRPKPATTKAVARRVDLRLSFELGSAELTAQAREEAKVFAQALQMPSLQSKRFVIEGHTDAQGSRASNLDLSQRRARAVADFLSSLGVSRDRFEVRGYGPDRPLPGRSAASQDNRRVEAVLVS